MIDTCYVGDVRDGLRAFIAAGMRAQTCVTSPPYWGLRDYGVPGQLGLERTPAEFIANQVAVFRLVREVLAEDGTCWINMGDSYATGTSTMRQPSRMDFGDATNNARYAVARNGNPFNLAPKQLVGMPWRLAFALQDDGWYLRSDIIWHKPNPMPESVTDRPTKGHEYLFLLAKSERYFYDAAAIAERGVTGDERRPYGSPGANQLDPRGRQGEGRPRAIAQHKQAAIGQNDGGYLGCNDGFATRNRRTVWTIAPEPYSEAHFATFPTALVEPCILAGSRVGDIVLDPFMGSGTVAQVAQSLGRHWIGCELNPAYVAMQRMRAAQRGLELVA